jgi:hypothetical protein
MGLHFVRVARNPDPYQAGDATSREIGGDAALRLPDSEGWRWEDVWFDRPGAEEIARRYETSTMIAMSEGTGMEARNVSAEMTSIAEVKSTQELVAMGDYELLGRVLVAVQLTLATRLQQFAAGVRFGESPD